MRNMFLNHFLPNEKRSFEKNDFLSDTRYQYVLLHNKLNNFHLQLLEGFTPLRGDMAVI